MYDLVRVLDGLSATAAFLHRQSIKIGAAAKRQSHSPPNESYSTAGRERKLRENFHCGLGAKLLRFLWALE